jgi:hypothetical protein
MRVLLLHPQDALPQPDSEKWDLIVDFGRAPKATYERWSRDSGCDVISLYDFAEEVRDLDMVRQLLQLGAGRVVDRWGIDWWEILSVEIVPQLQQLILVHRLAKHLNTKCELYANRPHSLAAALQRLLGARMTIRETRARSAMRTLRHYHESFSQLNTEQFAQVLEDKFDGDHSLRRRFVRRGPKSNRPVTLLPSAYTNVSRTALSYAELLPARDFLLVLTRHNAKPRLLPPNVRMASLTPYFASNDKRETASLLESWEYLRERLIGAAGEFKSAEEAGVLGRIPALVSWGVAIRGAWSEVFASQNVIACLCADDSNPLSSIPLIMAKKRGLPALACHHGALDYQMGIKTNQADSYLAKSEMERDYLQSICRVASDRIVIAEPSRPKVPSSQNTARRSAAPWLVFLTEPYHCHGWHIDEVYREILPRLFSLAEACDVKLVFKLHPLESIKGHRRMLQRLIPEHEREIEIIAGPPTPQLWSNTRFAMTVQSSTAVECAALNIPVFLCAWLRDAYSGYVSQFGRFEVGRVLDSPDQISEIPELLTEESRNSFQARVSRRSVEREQLTQFLAGRFSLPVASNG